MPDDFAADASRLFGSLVDTLPQLVSIARPDGTLVYVNQAYAEACDLAPAAMVGRSLYDLVAADDREAVRQQLQRVLDTGQTQRGENRLCMANDRERLVAWTNSLLPGPLLQSVGEDLTERRRLERRMAENENFLRRLADSLPIRIAYLDRERRYRFVNQRFLEFFGRSAEAVIGRTRAELRSDLDHPTLAEHAAAVLEGEVRQFEFDEPMHGVMRRFENRLMPDRGGDGRVRGFFVTGIDITDRARAEQAQRTLTAIFDVTTDFVVQTDLQGRLIYLNPAARRRSGVALDAPIERYTIDHFHPPAVIERLRHEIVPAALTHGVWVGESVAWDEHRRELPVSHIVIAHRDRRGKVEMFSAILRDISQSKAAELAMRESEARLRTVADALPMRVAYIDAHERYRFNNLAYERRYALKVEQILGLSVRELLGEPGYRRIEPYIRRALQGEAVTFQIENAEADAWVCYEAQFIPQRAADGRTVDGFHAVIADVTPQKREERRLVELARIDALTGVINRTGFEFRLGEAMQRCRAGQALLALMYLDIDRFKQINDRHGHHAGDVLLKAFAARIVHTLRATDTVARLGGDEFVVLLEGLPGAEAAAAVADKIVETMREPFAIDTQELAVTTSIGVAFYRGGALSAAELIKDADRMLYAAKGAGRNNVQISREGLEAGDGGA